MSKITYSDIAPVRACSHTPTMLTGAANLAQLAIHNYKYTNWHHFLTLGVAL